MGSGGDMEQPILGKCVKDTEQKYGKSDEMEKDKKEDKESTIENMKSSEGVFLKKGTAAELNLLLDMGFGQNAAEKALYFCQGKEDIMNHAL